MPQDLKKQIEASAVSVFNELYANFKQRIFGQGKDVFGGNIGSYSKKSFYVSVAKEGSVFKTSSGSQVSNAGLKPRGKKESGYNYNDFKNGNKRKSSYFKSGYSEFRTAVKRQNTKVDLSLTGQLQVDVRAIRVKGGFLEIAIVGERSINKARGNEKHFKKDIFEVSAKEQAQALIKIEKEAERLILKNLGLL